MIFNSASKDQLDAKLDKTGGKVNGAITTNNGTSSGVGGYHVRDKDGTVRQALTLDSTNTYRVGAGGVVSNINIGGSKTDEVYIYGNRVAVMADELEAKTTLNAGVLTTDTVTSTVKSIDSNKTATINIDTDKTELSTYTPIAIVGFKLSGTGSNNCSVYSMYINDSGVAVFGVRNNGTATASVTVVAYVLYEAD